MKQTFAPRGGAGPKTGFTRTTGLEEAKAFLDRALSSGKFPHALLVHGPEGVGQNALILDLADILLCESAVERPCRKCPACAQGRRGGSERMHFLLPLEKAGAGSGGDGEPPKELDGPQMEEMIGKTDAFLGDPYGFGISGKDMIRIVQIRDLQGRLAYAGASARSRVVLLPWAELLNESAANALLKTLEEPPAGTYFLLSSANRRDVKATILSRCTHLPVAPLEEIPFAAAVAARKEWWNDAPPTRLVPFAEGSLGVLLRLYRSGGEALLEETAAFLEAALQPDWRRFSEYLDGSPAFDAMDAAAPLLDFALKVIRALHRLRVAEGAGPVPAGPWIPGALARRGWDPALAGMLAAADRSGDLSGLAAMVETLLSAVQDYAKPRMAALGAWLEREAEFRSAAGDKAGAAPAGVSR